MAGVCPNKESKEWKALVKQVGEELANMAYVENGYEIPTVTPITEIKKAIGFKSKMENFAGMASRLAKYNAKNGTSHSFDKRLIYGNTWELIFKPNYLSTKAEKARQRLAVSNRHFRVEGEHAPGTETLYTPSPSEQEAGFFTEDGDFLPNADRNLHKGEEGDNTFDDIDTVDDLVGTASNVMKATELVRKKRFETEIRNHREELAEAKSNGDVAAVIDITQKIATLSNLIRDPKKGAERRLKLAEEIQTFEAVQSLAISQLKEVDAIVYSDNVSDRDLQYAQRIIDLWRKAGDFSVEPHKHILLDPDEFETPEIREIFQNIAKKADEYQSRITTIQKRYIADFVRNTTEDYNLTDEKIFEAIKDISYMGSRTLNVGRTGDPKVQAIYLAIQKANLEAQKEAGEIWEELDKLTAKFLKKSGGNFEILKQKTKEGLETGRLVHRFSHQYYAERNAKVDAAFNFYDRSKKEFVSRPKKVKEYFDWVNRNTIAFDPRLLIPDSQMGDNSIPEEFLYKHPEGEFSEADKAKHIAELKKHLGEKGYEFYLERQTKKLERFKVDRQAKYMALQSADRPKSEKDAEFQEWLREYSPYWAVTMQENPKYRQRSDKSYYKPQGMRSYVESVPRKEVLGQKTEWYDDAFAKIEADEDLLNYYNYVIENLNQAKYLLPSDKQKLLGVGVIPTIEKSIMDSYMEDGMLMGIAPFMDKLRKLQSTTDSGTNITADVNPLTGKIEKEINIKYVQDTEAKASEMVRIKRIKFEQENGRPANSKETRALREEALHELSQQKSWDVTRIMKAHMLNVLAYKHKSLIQPKINMTVEQLMLSKEKQTNVAGEVLTKDGEPVPEEGLANLKEAFDYFMDTTFYEVGGRKIEGERKKKVYTSDEKKRKAELEALIENETDEDKLEFLNQELEKLGRFKSLSGTGDMLLKWMTLKGLGWNFFSGGANVGFGLVSNFIQASDGREYSKQQLNKAYMLTMNSIGRNLSFNAWEGVNGNALKIRKLMDKWDLLQTSNKELYDLTNKSSMSKLKRFGPFSIQERTEYLNYAPVMIATMMTFKATDPDGNEVELWDAYGADGKLKEGFSSDVDEAKMVLKIKRIIEMNHGDYNNALMVKKTIGGRALSQFRTWMFEGFANRFESGVNSDGTPKIDYILSYGRNTPYVRKGRYRSYTKGQMITTGSALGTMFLPGIGTAVGAGAGYLVGAFATTDSNESVISDVLYTLKHLARKLVFSKSRHTDFNDKFTEVDAANMRKNMTELYIMLGLMGVALLMRAAADDDEEKKNLGWNYALNMVTRLRTDIAFYTNPLEFEKLTKTAVPVAQLVQDTYEFISDVKNLFNDDVDDDTFRSGTFKGEYKATVHGIDMMPLGGIFVRAYRTGDKPIE